MGKRPRPRYVLLPQGHLEAQFCLSAHLAVADSVVLSAFLQGRLLPQGQGLGLRRRFLPYLLFLLATNRAAGIFFLTAVAVDRYLKIVHPLNRINRMGLTYALWVSVGPVGSHHSHDCLPPNRQAFLLSKINRTQCESFNICLGRNALSDWHNSFYIIQFFVPTGIVIYCTACITWQLKSKTVDTQGKIKRAVQFILAVACSFHYMFLPEQCLPYRRLGVEELV